MPTKEADKTETKKKEQQTRKETEYEIAEIIANNDQFGVRKFVLIGALNNKGDSFSKKEVQSLVKQFLKQGVK